VHLVLIVIPLIFAQQSILQLALATLLPIVDQVKSVPAQAITLSAKIISQHSPATAQPNFLLWLLAFLKIRSTVILSTLIL